MSIRLFGKFVLQLALVASAVFGTGCVTNGRRILLKEYGSSIPVLAEGTLKGSTICLKGFTCTPDLVSLELQTKPEEPKPFKYLDFSREIDKRWDTEMKAMQKRTTEAQCRKIGNMRNGFGMVMSHVYAMNDPAVWLAESLKFDLEAQGAKVVDASQAAEADVLISGTVQLCRLDMYMTMNGSIVVDLDMQPKQGSARHKQIHTHGATVAMLASEGEYFHA
ncbi:MAG: hypothetical protein EXS31_17425, partial [Pedosphaera sp.]|nr:hypothetical protein [Pedosphaera sp.]